MRFTNDDSANPPAQRILLSSAELLRFTFIFTHRHTHARANLLRDSLLPVIGLLFKKRHTSRSGRHIQTSEHTYLILVSGRDCFFLSLLFFSLYILRYSHTSHVLFTYCGYTRLLILSSCSCSYYIIVKIANPA